MVTSIAYEYGCRVRAFAKTTFFSLSWVFVLVYFNARDCRHYITCHLFYLICQNDSVAAPKGIACTRVLPTTHTLQK